MRVEIFLLTCVGSIFADDPSPSSYIKWLERFGHDDFTYPEAMVEDMAACDCFQVPEGRPQCTDKGSLVNWRASVMTAAASGSGGGASAASSNAVTFCLAKAWLLEHMPEFDLDYLPPSVSVNVTSMLDDVAAFAALADSLVMEGGGGGGGGEDDGRGGSASGSNGGLWSDLPLGLKLAYGLPYAAYHEARTNWRPLLFAKHIALVSGATTTGEAVKRLVAPNMFLDWTGNSWEGSPRPAYAPSSDDDVAVGQSYSIEWQSSTNPPVVGPFEFVASGYSSCTGWASMITYILRAVGVPARQVGTPCWNSGDFSGLSSSNANVSKCWSGGDGSMQGGTWLNNHNWVEYFDTELNAWAFINVPPTNSTPNSGLPGCSGWTEEHGCGYNASAAANTAAAATAMGPLTSSSSPSSVSTGKVQVKRGVKEGGVGVNEGVEGGCASAWSSGQPGSAMRDHEIFAATWSLPQDTGIYDGNGNDGGGNGDGGGGLLEWSEGGEVVDAASMVLSSGEAASPLVWAPKLTSPLGVPLKDNGLRMVNRTTSYRCKE